MNGLVENVKVDEDGEPYVASVEPAQHTPGPWRIDPKHDDAYHILGAGEASWPSGGIATLDYTGGNAEANAVLIAQAPTLLAQRDALVEALEDVLTGLKMHNIQLLGADKAHAVVARIIIREEALTCDSH